MSKGFIPIRRTLFEHFLYNEHRVFSRFEAWLDLIQLASFVDGQTELIKGKAITRNRGEIVASIRWIASRWNWSIHKTCDFVEVLRSQEMVVVGKEGGVTKLSLVNFERYNSIGRTENDMGSKRDSKTRNGTGLDQNDGTQKEQPEKNKRCSKRDSETQDSKGLDESAGTAKGTQNDTVREQSGNSQGTNINKDNKEKKGEGEGGADAPLPPPRNKTEEKQLAMLEREKEFYQSLVPHLSTYGKEMIRAFYDYWREANKSRTKMKWELEETWVLELRLVKWEDNDVRWKKSGATAPAAAAPKGPPLAKIQEEVNSIYSQWCANPEQVTVTSITDEHFAALKAEELHYYISGWNEVLWKMARAHMTEKGLQGPAIEDALIRAFGVLEIFKQLKTNGKNRIFNRP